jgi:seryl-tRNA synthetase
VSQWKELKGTDIWTCSPLESANENLDRKIKEVNAKVEEVKKEIGDKQDQPQTAEITALKERMALLEANSGYKILKEVEERKTREMNLVFYRIPEEDEDRSEVRREEDETRVKLVLQEIGASQEGEIKFSRRIGEKLEEQGARPLLVGVDSVQTTEAILDR